MKYDVKCIFCNKEWQSKEPDFLTVCGCCVKSTMLYFETQFTKYLPLKAKVLRTENK